MIIHSGYGVLTYNTSSKIALQQQGNGVTKSSSTNPTGITLRNFSSDQ